MTEMLSFLKDRGKLPPPFVRKTLHNDELWFSIVDVVSVLTDSADPSGYIKGTRRRDAELSKGWGQIAIPFSIRTEGGPRELGVEEELSEGGTVSCPKKSDN